MLAIEAHVAGGAGGEAVTTFRAAAESGQLTARASRAADAFRKSMEGPGVEDGFRFVAADLVSMAAQLGSSPEEAAFGILRVQREGLPPVVLELDEGGCNVQAVCGGAMLQLGGCAGYRTMEEQRCVALQFTDDAKVSSQHTVQPTNTRATATARNSHPRRLHLGYNNPSPPASWFSGGTSSPGAFNRRQRPLLPPRHLWAAAKRSIPACLPQAPVAEYSRRREVIAGPGAPPGREQAPLGLGRATLGEPRRGVDLRQYLHQGADTPGSEPRLQPPTLILALTPTPTPA